MAIFNLFSKRQKKLREGEIDVFVYDTIPENLRVQIIHIWWDTLGNKNEYWNKDNARRSYKFLTETLRREYGLFRLPPTKEYDDENYMAELANHFLAQTDQEKALDVIELSFRIIDRITRNYNHLHKSNASEIADNAIEELNSRFKEHGIGYQYIDGEIIRVDSQHIHSEIIKPALVLLHDKSFSGAQEEYLKAYEHYRHSNSKEALNEALKAFESTMKIICDKRKWSYPPKATSSKLIEVCLNNNLIPSFWQQQFSALRSVLESGIPTGRNNLGGHGQGTTTIQVPNYLVAYMLHMTASAIVFLVEANQQVK